MRVTIFLLVLLYFSSGFVAAAAEERIVWRQSGNPDGRALILLPGLMSDGSVFDDVLEDFRSTARIEQATLRGFAGVAPLQDIDAVIEPAAEAVVAHLRMSGITRAILVGHSIGGQIVLKASRLAPDLVDDVIVIDSLPFLAGLYRPQVTLADARAQANAMAAGIATLPDEQFLAYQQQSVQIMSKAPGRQRTILDWSLASDRKTASIAIAEAFGSDWRDGMSGVEARVTVLAAHDATMPIARDDMEAIYRSQYSGLENLDLVIVDNSYHFIMYDRPDALITVISGVMEQGQ